MIQQPPCGGQIVHPVHQDRNGHSLPFPRDHRPGHPGHAVHLSPEDPQAALPGSRPLIPRRMRDAGGGKQLIKAGLFRMLLHPPEQLNQMGWSDRIHPGQSRPIHLGKSGIHPDSAGKILHRSDARLKGALSRHINPQLFQQHLSVKGIPFPEHSPKQLVQLRRQGPADPPGTGPDLPGHDPRLRIQLHPLPFEQLPEYGPRKAGRVLHRSSHTHSRVIPPDRPRDDQFIGRPLPVDGQGLSAAGHRLGPVDHPDVLRNR